MTKGNSVTIDKILFSLLDGANVPHKSKESRNKAIFRDFHGLGGGEGTTLEEQGESNGGLTRECVRQVVNNIQAQFFLDQKEKAMGQRLIDIVRNRIPCALSSLRDELISESLISESIESPEGVLNLCMSVMKVKPIARYQNVNGTTYVVPHDKPGLIKKVQSEALKVVGGFGACSIESVVSRLGKYGDCSPVFVKGVLDSALPITWLDEGEKWFTTGTDYTNCFVRRIETVFSVYESVPVETLYRVMARSLRQIKINSKTSPEYKSFGMGALGEINEARASDGKELLKRKPSIKESKMRMAFDISVFKSLLKTMPGVALVGSNQDEVTVRAFSLASNGPSTVEKKILKTLSNSEEKSMRESDIKTSAGLNDKEWYGFIAASNFSPLLSRVDRGQYKLIGQLS
jgi:hypothetical protein